MVWWYYAIAFVVALVVGFALTPKPQTVTPGIGEIEAPTAEDGREIPVLFGTRNLTGPNVVWYGDVKTTPIKSSGGGKK
jgi:hypothetical protein